MEGEEGTGVEKWAKKKLQFIALVSFFSFLCSYYSGFSSYNLQVSTLIFSLFAHAIDRKYVFLICNGILALLVNNFTFFGFIKSAEDGAKQIPSVIVGQVAPQELPKWGPASTAALKIQHQERDLKLSSTMANLCRVLFLFSLLSTLNYRCNRDIANQGDFLSIPSICLCDSVFRSSCICWTWTIIVVMVLVETFSRHKMLTAGCCLQQLQFFR